jgi:hypothetical protein
LARGFRAAVTLVAGEPGSCKGWLALCLGKAVAEGMRFLERACPLLPRLYLDREIPQAVIRERVDELGIPRDRAVARLGRMAGRRAPLCSAICA